MGLLSRFRKKKEKLDEPKFPANVPQQQPAQTAPAVPMSSTSSIKAEMDLVLSQMENLRMQYEAINAKLQNIERVVTEIRSFCR
jgi:hypothetical protein